MEPPTIGEDPHEPLSFYPVLVGNLVLVHDGQRILAVRLDTGKPAWGQAAIYQSQLAGIVTPSLPSDMFGLPRFTMTVFENRLLARMGSPVTGQPQGATAALRPGYLVCLDLAAEGRLLWKAEPEEGWALEGSPVADDRGVYVAMRRQDVRPQAFVACFDPDTGRLRWRRFICGAETPARGVFYESSHNLLTLDGDTLYYNTNLGAVAAVGADDGRPLWVSLYPRARQGNLAKLAPHWRRDLNPCILDHGTLLVAPADSPRIFAFDAATGQALWQTGTEVEDAVHLLGVTQRVADCRRKEALLDQPAGRRPRPGEARVARRRRGAGLRPRPAGRPGRLVAHARQAVHLRCRFRPSRERSSTSRPAAPPAATCWWPTADC